MLREDIQVQSKGVNHQRCGFFNVLLFIAFIIEYFKQFNAVRNTLKINICKLLFSFERHVYNQKGKGNIADGKTKANKPKKHILICLIMI